MSFYSELAADVVEILREFGQEWTFTTTTAAATSTSRTAVGVMVDTVKHLIGDSGAQIGDRVFLFEAGATPLQNDRITDGTDSYVLSARPEPIKPAATVVAWWAWGREG